VPRKEKKRTKMLDGKGIKRKEKISTLKREYIVERNRKSSDA
jgi:hypothetical protein